MTKDASQVYSSTDAVTWTLETDATGIPARGGFALGVFEDKLFLSGGNNDWSQVDPGTYHDDLWSSEDGVTWTQVTTSGLAKRGFHSIAILDHRMWLVGGSDRVGPRSDVRSSLDGVNWVSEAGPEALGIRLTGPLVNFGDRLWVFGGETGNRTLADAWSSPDGVRWEREGDLPGDGRATPVVAHGGKLFLVGGGRGQSLRSNDVWSSDDGKTWTELIANGSAPFSERQGHALVSAGGTLFLLGGRNNAAQPQSDVWTSTDGISWSVVTPNNPALTGRDGVGYVVMDDVIYAIGGRENDVYMSDVWSSTDGETWTLVTADGGYGGRMGHGVIAHAGQLYAIGGRIGDGPINNTNSVWSSDDGGVTWVEQAATPPFAERFTMGAGAFGDKLFIFGGGLNFVQYGDTWTSDDDGASWRKPYRSVFRL